MGQNTNVGQQTSLAVYGNPESFKKLISNHGLLAKVKQAMACPCIAGNNGQPSYYCESCNGDGYVYTYQRNFFITDENSNVCGNTVVPYWNPIRSVSNVQTITSELQGGQKNFTVESFDDTTITVTEDICKYAKKRVSYYFDGWTYIEKEKLVVDATNKLMYANGTIFDAGQQSSNPIKAYADIAEIVRIWDDSTGTELSNYTFEGNTISTTQTIANPDDMCIEYYQADLTKVITTDINNNNINEVYTHDMESGECKIAFYPFFEIAIGDIVTLSAVVLYKNEMLQRGKSTKNLDRLSEIEVFSISDKILDEDGKKYTLNTDFILQGRNIKWLSANKPAQGKAFSVRIGYKPSYIIFENNPLPNNLENKQYPITVLAKSWTKASKDDIAKLIGGN